MNVVCNHFGIIRLEAELTTLRPIKLFPLTFKYCPDFS